MSYINWKLFDKIYCVHYLPYKERLHNIKLQLDKIGILNSSNFEFYYTTPNKYYDYIFLSHKNFKNINNVVYYKQMNNTQYTDHPSVLDSDIDFRFINNTNINLLVNMLELLYQIQHHGYQRVLIIEDDIFFHKDIELIKYTLDNMPQDYNIINFDPYIYNINKYNPIDKNDYYFDVSKSEIYNASCITIDQKTISKLLEWQSDMSLPWDNYLQYKGLKDDDLIRYMPKKNICIQRDYSTRQEYYHNNDKLCKYKHININMNEYYDMGKI